MKHGILNLKKLYAITAVVLIFRIYLSLKEQAEFMALWMSVGLFGKFAVLLAIAIAFFVLIPGVYYGSIILFALPMHHLTDKTMRKGLKYKGEEAPTFDQTVRNIFVKIVGGNDDER